MRPFRTIEDLSPQERRFLSDAALGVEAHLGQDGNGRPVQPSPECTIGASLLRFVALGGDSEFPVHAHGVRLRGAFVTGTLDLESCPDIRPIRCLDCTFDSPLVLRYGRFRDVRLTGSRVPAILGHGLSLDGDCLLDSGFRSDGTVWLVASRITGGLVCAGGTFLPSSPDEARHHLELSDRIALHLSGAHIGLSLVLGPNFQQYSEPAALCGDIDLGHCTCAVLVDAPEAYASDHHIHINGFVYDHLAGGATATGYRERKAWLELQPAASLGERFRPQPFTQMVKVLRSMGHERDARELDILRERLALRRPWFGKPWWRNPLNLVRWLVAEKATGYGYRPHRPVIGAVILIVLSALFFSEAERNGIMAPRNPVVFTENALQLCRDRWTACEHIWMVNEYTAFSAPVYAIDIFLPIVSLSQEQDWAPMVRAWDLALPGGIAIGIHPWAAMIVVWVNILLGWVVSLVLVALISGAFRRD